MESRTQAPAKKNFNGPQSLRPVPPRALRITVPELLATPWQIEMSDLEPDGGHHSENSAYK